MYTLRFPFQLPPGRAISHPESEFELGGLTVALYQDDFFYVLKVSGFESEQLAKAYIAHVSAGLMWLLLNRSLAAKAEWTLQKVAFAQGPEQAARNLRESWGGLNVGDKVHGIIDGAWPAVYPSDGNFRKVTANPVSVLQTTGVSDVVYYLQQGFQAARPDALQADEKLRTALELYGAFFTEGSQRARFLTLVMVLEALSEGRKRPQLVQMLLDKFVLEVEKLEATVGSGSDDADALGAIKREIFFRREDSIRSQIRQLVLNTLALEPDCQETAQQAVRLYDKRSTLVHEGSLPRNELSKAVTDAKHIVERVLKARFVKVVGLQVDA